MEIFFLCPWEKNFKNIYFPGLFVYISGLAAADGTVARRTVNRVYTVMEEDAERSQVAPHLSPTWAIIQTSNASDEVMGKIAKKRELMEGKILFEADTLSPAPSKDICYLVITEKGVMWRKWKISLRGVTSGSAPVPQPVEECMTHIDFKCDDTLMVSWLHVLHYIN